MLKYMDVILLWSMIIMFNIKKTVLHKNRNDSINFAV